MAESQFAQPKRWSAKRKTEIVLRLLRGEPVDEISREIGIEIYRLEEWRQEGLANLEASFKSRTSNPMEGELARAKQKIGELSMEVELLNERVRKQGPLVLRRSTR